MRSIYEYDKHILFYTWPNFLLGNFCGLSIDIYRDLMYNKYIDINFAQFTFFMQDYVRYFLLLWFPYVNIISNTILF